jgi:hypothetical protein
VNEDDEYMTIACCNFVAFFWLVVAAATFIFSARILGLSLATTTLS